MCTADAAHTDGSASGAGSGRNFESALDALRITSAAMDYLSTAAASDLDGPAGGDLLIALGEVQPKLTAAHAALLRRPAAPLRRRRRA